MTIYKNDPWFQLLPYSSIGKMLRLEPVGTLHNSSCKSPAFNTVSQAEMSLNPFGQLLFKGIAKYEKLSSILRKILDNWQPMIQNKALPNSVPSHSASVTHHLLALLPLSWLWQQQSSNTFPHKHNWNGRAPFSAETWTDFAIIASAPAHRSLHWPYSVVT